MKTITVPKGNSNIEETSPKEVSKKDIKPNDRFIALTQDVNNLYHIIFMRDTELLVRFATDIEAYLIRRMVNI